MSGDDWLYGGGGDDYLFAKTGNDHLFGGAGDDELRDRNGSNFYDGGPGTDRCPAEPVAVDCEVRVR